MAKVPNRKAPQRKPLPLERRFVLWLTNTWTGFIAKVAGVATISGSLFLAVAPDLAKSTLKSGLDWFYRVDKTIDDAAKMESRINELQADLRANRAGTTVVINNQTLPQQQPQRTDHGAVVPDFPVPPPETVLAGAEQATIPARFPTPAPAVREVSPPAAPTPRGPSPASPAVTGTPIRLSSLVCVPYPITRGTLIELDIGDRFCSLDKLQQATVTNVEAGRIRFWLGGKDFTCKSGDRCSFDWPHAPTFQLVDVPLNNSTTTQIVFR